MDEQQLQQLTEQLSLTYFKNRSGTALTSTAA